MKAKDLKFCTPENIINFANQNTNTTDAFDYYNRQMIKRFQNMPTKTGLNNIRKKSDWVQKFDPGDPDDPGGRFLVLFSQTPNPGDLDDPDVSFVCELQSL